MPDKSRVRVYMACSLDGVIAGPDNDLSFLHDPGPEGAPPASPDVLEFDDFMTQVGAMLMGRTTFDVVDAMDVPWPYGDILVLVATHRPLPADAPATVRAVCGSIEELVERAKETVGRRDVYLDGGALIRQGLQAGLVDELCITFVPLIHGDGGTRLFDGLQGSTKLEFTAHANYVNGLLPLTQTRAYPLKTA